MWMPSRRCVCTTVFLAGVLLALSALTTAASAQSSGTEPAGKPAAAEKHKKAEKAPKLPRGADPQFVAMLNQVRQRGLRSQVPDYISHDLGLVNVNLPRAFAYRLSSSDDQRAIAVFDEIGSDWVLMMQASEPRIVFVTNSSGMLKKAGVMSTGRLNSVTVHPVPLAGVEDAYQTEKEFWMKQLRTGDPVVPKLADPAN
jgi:hypothetical protein